MTWSWRFAGDAARALRTGTFRSLESRNFRLYFFAQLVSSSGTWIQLIAENWLVVRLGGSGLALGVTTALQFTPLLLFSAYGGVLVDRWNKRRLLTFTQSAAGVLALAVALLTISGVVRIWMVWVAAFLLGCVNALDSPGQQAFNMELAGRDNVANAVALRSAVTQGARTIGPAIGGVLIATLGIGPCFLVNAASYAAVVAALRVVDPSHLFVEATAPVRRGQVREGLRYIWRNPTLRTVLVIVAIVGTFGTNFQLLLTLLASQTFHEGAAFYGLLMACLGIGMILGSLLVANWHHPSVLGVGVFACALGAAHALVAFAPTFVAALATVVIMGAAGAAFLTAAAGCLQVTTGERMRGRVMALYTIGFLGTAPIGGPIVGWIAEHYRTSSGLLTGALACAVAGGVAVLASSTALRPERVKSSAEVEKG